MLPQVKVKVKEQGVAHLPVRRPSAPHQAWPTCPVGPAPNLLLAVVAVARPTMEAEAEIAGGGKCPTLLRLRREEEEEEIRTSGRGARVGGLKGQESVIDTKSVRCVERAGGRAGEPPREVEWLARLLRTSMYYAHANTHVHGTYTHQTFPSFPLMLSMREGCPDVRHSLHACRRPCLLAVR